MQYTVLSSDFLKQRYQDLANQDSSTLVPVMDRLVTRLIINLERHPENYEVSDSITTRNEFGTASYLVAGGKIVPLTVDYQDIDEDDDDMWWMRSGISLGITSKNVQEAQKLLSRFEDFGSNQSLDEIMKEARAELSKGKLHHLSESFRRFYQV